MKLNKDGLNKKENCTVKINSKNTERDCYTFSFHIRGGKSSNGVGNYY